MTTTDTTTTAKSVRVEVDFSGHPVRTNAELDAAMASLRAELTELRKYKARFDWMEENVHSLHYGLDCKICVRGEDGMQFVGDTWVEAIDATMNYGK